MNSATALVLSIVMVFVLFAGEPDLMDAIIKRLSPEVTAVVQP